MLYLDITELPAVKEIMQKCIKEIEAICGKTIVLKIQDAEVDADLKKAGVIAAVCNKYDVAWEKVKGRRRDGDILRARHAYIYIATTYLRQTMGKTAADLGKYNHSNISCTMRKIKGFFDVKDQEAEVIQSIIDNLKL